MATNLALQQLALDLTNSFELPEAANTAFNKRYSPLWLCLYLPRLALDLQKQPGENPQLIIEEVKGRYMIYCGCDMASGLGITSGMTLNSAYALSSELITYQRDNEIEKLALKKLADWSQQFTPAVSIEPEKNCVMLEIRASLDLFGGLLALQQKVLTLFKENFSYKAKLAVAPTPLASQILARFSDAPLVEEESALRSILGRLPISALLLEDKKTQQKLHKIGVETLKELWRLPRDSLARRFGKALIQHLDKLLGTRTDPQLIHQAPVTFDGHIELPYESSNNKTVFVAAQQLLERLEKFLTKRDCGITKLYFRLTHFDKSSRDIDIGLRQCSRDAAHILLLLEERLDRLKLHAAVCEVRLIVDEVLPFVAHNQDVFPSHLLADSPGDKHDDPEWQNLLEQLQNRFGLHAVQYLQTVDDHRPEFAWSYQHQGKKQTTKESEFRPLWLLPTAQSLKQHKNRPFHLGPLVAMHGPERIESGWWEDDEISRDYYIVRDVDNRRLWVYRDLKQKQWYLHGFFG